LHKALALVLAHAVTLHPDGTASVQSGKQTYRLAPDCPCADATHWAALCTHTLAVELHRRALALLDSTAPASRPTAAAAPASAAPPPSAEAAPAAPAPAEDTRQERLPSADRREVTEAPASCCLRLRVGDLEIRYTIEFTPIKPLAATDSSALGSCAGHSRVPSPGHGPLASTGGCGLSRYDSA